MERKTETVVFLASVSEKEWLRAEALRLDCSIAEVIRDAMKACRETCDWLDDAQAKGLRPVLVPLPLVR
jgi:hypothetical protein